MINTLKIENFKSIKNIEFNPKKINLFIGKPNVGKSNILEALSLFCLPLGNFIKITDLVRMKNNRNLFYDNDVNNELKVTSNFGAILGVFSFMYNSLILKTISTNDFNLNCEKNDIDFFLEQDENFYHNLQMDKIEESIAKISELYNFSYNKISNDFKNINYFKYFDKIKIKKYYYNSDIKSNNFFDKFLLPPYGQNINTILQKNTILLQEFGEYLRNYDLDLVLDIEKNVFETQKRINNYVYKYPYVLLADSLKRLFFYLTAIDTNNNSVLLFEEPEVHSFPPYVKTIAERICQNETNQYFITTHSPYLLKTIIENTKNEDLNIVITYFDDFATNIKVLDEQEVQEFYELEEDVFFNLDKFI